jgi:hypothetical protein
MRSGNRQALIISASGQADSRLSAGPCKVPAAALRVVKIFVHVLKLWPTEVTRDSTSSCLCEPDSIPAGNNGCKCVVRRRGCRIQFGIPTVRPTRYSSEAQGFCLTKVQRFTASHFDERTVHEFPIAV